MKDLWPQDFTNKRFVCNAVDLLTEQAALLKDKTGGVVQAALLPIQPPTAVATLIAGLATLPTVDTMEAPDEMSEKTDINAVFEPRKFKFELYSASYHFRVFTLYNRPQYPIDIVLDEGIAEELALDLDEKKRRVTIDNKEELEALIRNIFSCRKIAMIISHMISNNQPGN